MSNNSKLNSKPLLLNNKSVTRQKANKKHDFSEDVERIRKKAEENRKKIEMDSKQEIMENNIIRLPVWPETERRFPNELLRSALFNARHKTIPRKFFKEEEIVVMFEGKITYQGEELRQDDLIVWLQLIHLARKQPVGKAVEFTPYSFCKAINWAVNGHNYERLRECLRRMQTTSLSVYSKRLKRGVSLSMIPIFEWQDNKNNALKKYQVQLAPKLVELFQGVHFTQFEWEQRLKLPVGIATWLHGYYASHREPFPIKIVTIVEGSGISTKRERKAKELIERALEELKQVGFLKSWKIVGDLVHVERSPRR